MKHFLYKIPSTFTPMGYRWHSAWYNRIEDVKVFHPTAFDITEIK